MCDDDFMISFSKKNQEYFCSARVSSLDYLYKHTSTHGARHRGVFFFGKGNAFDTSIFRYFDISFLLEEANTD